MIGTPLGPAQVSPGQTLSWAMLIINKQKENKFFCYSSLKMHRSLYFKQLDNLFKKNTIEKLSASLYVEFPHFSTLSDQELGNQHQTAKLSVANLKPMTMPE